MDNRWNRWARFEVIKPKRIGCCGTPCFISRKKRVLVGGKWPSEVPNPAHEGRKND